MIKSRGIVGNDYVSRIGRGMIMISVSDAQKFIFDHIPSVKTESISIDCSHGRILKEKIKAQRNQPPFHRVCMDGIGIVFNQLNQDNQSFIIEDLQKAGDFQKVLSNPKSCMEVMTGATLPVGIDTVIRYEDLNIENGTATIIKGVKISPKQNIHFEGSDHLKEDLLLKEDVILKSSHIGILASEGKKEVTVSILPKVAIISTGDELVDIDETPLPHQIRRSNSYTLKSELQNFGFNDVTTFHLKDDEKTLYSSLEKILNDFPFVVLSGGVSMGKFDFIPSVLSDLKVKKVFHKVKQRPGKPFWFGQGTNQQMVFGLPGNPVSCLVNLRRYVIPALFKYMGLELESSFAVLKESISFKKSLTYFPAVKTSFSKEGIQLAMPIKSNGSGDYFSLHQSDGILELPSDKEIFNEGEAYPFYRWGSWEK